MKMDYSIIFKEAENFSYECNIYQYWIIMNGTGKIECNNGNYTFTSHDVFCFPQNTVMKVYPNGPLEIGCTKLTDFEATNPSILQIPHPHTELIRKTFLYAYDLQGSYYLNKDAMLSCVSELMFQAFLCLTPEAMSLNDIVTAVIADMTEHLLDTDYDINNKIHEMGYTIGHFRKLFRKETGTSPHHFLISHRIEHACKLMQQSSLPIQKIAIQSGFKDPLYFSKLFRKYKGMSPSTYRASVFKQEK